MKAFSNSKETWSSIPLSIGSACPVSAVPPRSSSQLAPQRISMSLPVIIDLGRATGVVSIGGAEMSVS
jgi:hypothetical protein